MKLLTKTLKLIIARYPEVNTKHEAMEWIRQAVKQYGWSALTNGDSFSITTRENRHELALQFINETYKMART